MKKVSIEDLLSQWWDTHIDSRERLDALDWDQLLDAIDIEIDDYEGILPQISDYDTDGPTILVSFVGI